jgi:signal peptidase II
MRESRRVALWLLPAAGIVVIDQVSKWVVESTLPLGASIYVAPVFDLVHVRNTGAAFSFLADAAGWQRELFIGIGVAASIWIVWMIARTGRGQPLFCAALTLILGGAAGNVIDRLRLGAVVDFLHFHWGPHYFPAFNAADSAITCGAILLIADAIKQSMENRRRLRGQAPKST